MTKNLILIFFTFLITIAFLNYVEEDNKFNSAVEKSISSVVTIKTYDLNRLNVSNELGSGVIFSNKGYIVTNYHVIKNSSKVLVTLYDGKTLVADIMGSDQNSDIAILKINAETLEQVNSIDFADSESIRVGDKVLAIGNPYGIGISVSNGIISATGRDYGNPYLNLIQTDAPINPGNSGGALINEQGNLIGINTKIFSKTGAYQGISFAIPSEKITKIASEIIQYGKVREVWIGNFRVRPSQVEINSEKINSLQIIEIDNKGPLFTEGVKSGDHILNINENAASWKNLKNSLSFASPNDQINLKIFSDESIKKVEVIAIPVEMANLEVL